jgi:hypothetical protein
MKEMALIVPSRGRPQNILRLYEALKDTDSNVDLIVGVDEDDEKVNEYCSIVENRNFTLVISPQRRKFGPTLNAIAVKIWKDYKYLAWMGDDHLPITKNWDRRYVEELDKLHMGMVYGNDLVMGESIATQLAFTSKMVGLLGYAVPPGFTHLFIDNYFMKLFGEFNAVRYLPDVVIQHLHPIANKAQEDQTYREANSEENWNNDRAYFDWYVENKLKEDAEKLVQSI